jgi:hypothetical protein
MDVTGTEHRAGLVGPILGVEAAFNSLLAVAQDFRISSIHSKWPLGGCCGLDKTCISTTIDGHFEFFVQPPLKNHA